MSIRRTKVRTLDPSEQMLLDMKKVPLRTMADIREGRTPEGEPPPSTMATLVERKSPGRHRRVYAGPRWWEFRDWVLWHFGDLWSGLYEQDGYRPHRMV